MAAPVQQGPGKAGYWISTVLIVVGVLGGILAIVVGRATVVHSVDHFQRVPILADDLPSSINFTDTGRYSLYYEAPGVSSRSASPRLWCVSA